MLRKIRRGVFETNSSSTHSISIVAKEDFDKWKNGDKLYDRWTDKFVDSVEEAKYEDEVITYQEFISNDYLEYYEVEHTTKSGDKVVAFGRYGYDG